MISAAFTCTGPYAILILLGIKRVENRSASPSPLKGRCAISCSKKFCREEYGNFIQWASHSLTPDQFTQIPSWNDVMEWPGKIVGVCDYAVRSQAVSGEPWNEGYQYWWDLSEIVTLDRPIQCRGNVGMWRLPPDIALRVTAADQLAQAVGTRISTAEEAARLFRLAIPMTGGEEGFFVLPLDEDRNVLAEPVMVSLGLSSATTIVQPREVFAAAFAANAKSIVVAHNHPSGDPTPSVQDRELTDALRRMGSAIGLPVLDHLVVTDKSFATI